MEGIIAAVLLAVVQGLTEWLPISSSGHLLLFERMLDYQLSLAFEVALHLGTLLAVFVYFRKDIIAILEDILRAKRSKHSRLGLLLLIGSIPAALVGFSVKNYFDTILSDLLLAGVGFLVTGVLLLIVGFFPYRPPTPLTAGKSFLIGAAQAVAILPSISRSGSTIATGIFLGLDEKTAMKFSFLLSIPAILGANVVAGTTTLTVETIIGMLVAFSVGLATIHACFTHLLNKRKNFVWFGLYALLLGIIVIVSTFMNY